MRSRGRGWEVFGYRCPQRGALQSSSERGPRSGGGPATPAPADALLRLQDVEWVGAAWHDHRRPPATPVRCLRSGGLVIRRLREHLIRGIRGRPFTPTSGAEPSCIAASRGVTSLRSLRPCGRRSSGRVVVVDRRCAASRRALGGWAWCGCRPERQVETAKLRRLASRPGASYPTGGGGCVADLLGPSASRSRPDPTVRACKRWTRATRCAHALERQWPSSARGSRTPTHAHRPNLPAALSLGRHGGRLSMGRPRVKPTRGAVRFTLALSPGARCLPRGARPNGAPRLPRDLQDQPRDGEPDQRIGDRGPPKAARSCQGEPRRCDRAAQSRASA